MALVCTVYACVLRVQMDFFFLPRFFSPSPPKDYQHVLRPSLLELGSKCELTVQLEGNLSFKWVSSSACSGVGLLVGGGRCNRSKCTYSLSKHWHSALQCQRAPSPVVLYSVCGTDIDNTHHVDLVIENLREQKTRVYGNMDSFPSFYTRMVGVEAKVVCTKKTIRCCTAYFRGHGEDLRSFCTQRVQKNKVASQRKLYTHHLKTLLYEKYEASRWSHRFSSTRVANPVLLT
jgi:hypothetical protein